MGKYIYAIKQKQNAWIQRYRVFFSSMQWKQYLLTANKSNILHVNIKTIQVLHLFSKNDNTSKLIISLLYSHFCTSSGVPFTVKSSRGGDANVSFTLDCLPQNRSLDFQLSLQAQKSHGPVMADELQRRVEKFSQHLWGLLTHSLHKCESQGHYDLLLGYILQNHTLLHGPFDFNGKELLPPLEKETTKRVQSLHEEVNAWHLMSN